MKNSKRLIISIILGVIVSTIIFTILITVNMTSIDYSIAESSHDFSLLGQKYLEVSVSNHEPAKNVITGPIAITGIIASCIIYVLYAFIAGYKEKRGKNELSGK